MMALFLVIVITVVIMGGIAGFVALTSNRSDGSLPAVDRSVSTTTTGRRSRSGGSPPTTR